jgi:hypothetical protein
MTNEEWIECHHQEDFEQAIRAKADKDPDWYSRILSGDPAESLHCFVAWLNEEHDEEHEEEHEMTNDGMLMMAKRLAATAITDAMRKQERFKARWEEANRASKS